VLPESALRPGMRVLGPTDDFPTLPSCKVALVRNRADPSPLSDALAGHIVSSLDNLSYAGEKAPLSNTAAITRSAEADRDRPIIMG